jgi:hypothetical protein
MEVGGHPNASATLLQLSTGLEAQWAPRVVWMPRKRKCLLCLLLAARSPSPHSIHYTDHIVPNPYQRNVSSNVKKNTANKRSALMCYMACEFLLASPQNQITLGESDRVFEVSYVCV